MPGVLIIISDWLSRPGTASILIASLGIVQEWITSSDVVSKRILVK